MRPETGLRATLVSFGVILALAMAGLFLVGAHSSQVSWQFTLTPNCHSTVEHTFPSGASVSVVATPSAPPISPGGLWINVTGPTPTGGWNNGYIDVDSSPAAGSQLFGFVSVGGAYSFTACAIGGAPVTPVYVSATYPVTA